MSLKKKRRRLPRVSEEDTSFTFYINIDDLLKILLRDTFHDLTSERVNVNHRIKKESPLVTLWRDFYGADYTFDEMKKEADVTTKNAIKRFRWSWNHEFKLSSKSGSSNIRTLVRAVSSC